MFPKCVALLNLFQVALLQQGLGGQPAEICNTPTCIRAATQIAAAMNPAINPCDDFHEYACGRYKEDPVETEWMIDHIEETQFTNWGEQQAQNFYTSCIEPRGEEQDRANRDSYSKLIEYLGGWQFSSTPPEKVDWQKTLEKAQNKFKQNIFFSWTVEYDKNNLSKRDVYIFKEQGNSSYFLFKDLTPEDKLMHLMTLVEWLDDKHDPLVRQETEMNIRHALDLNEALKAIPPEGAPRTMDLNELQKSLPFLNWKLFFKRAYRRISMSIDPDKAFTVSIPKSFARMSNILMQYSMDPANRYILHNYIVLRTLHDLTNAYFRHSFLDKVKLRTACLHSTFKLLSIAMNAMYVRQTFPSGARVKEDIFNMYENIRKIVIRRLNQSPWLDEYTKKNAVSRANKIIFLPGYPDHYFNNTFMDEVYRGLNLRSSGFVANYFKILEFSRQANMKILYLPHQRDEHRDIFAAFERNAIYSHELNKVTLASGMMEEPMYNTEYPGYLRYGLMGFLLSHESMHAFFAPKVNGETWMTPEALTTFHNLSQCFVNQYAVHSFMGRQIDGKHTLDQNVADNSGILVAFHTYRALVEMAGPEPRLPGLDLNSEQLFFVKFAHFLCQKTETMEDFEKMHAAGYPTNELRVNVTLSNSPDFSQVFNCVNGRMNPPTKCFIW